jgi:hypothetical protein
VFIFEGDKAVSVKVSLKRVPGATPFKNIQMKYVEFYLCVSPN